MTSPAMPQSSQERRAERVITTPPTKRQTWRGMRDARHLSLREVEELVGINRGLLSRIEHGFGPTPDQARRLLAAYDDVEALDVLASQLGGGPR